MNTENRFVQLTKSLAALGLDLDDYLAINKYTVAMINSFSSADEAKEYLEEDFESLFVDCIDDSKWLDIDNGKCSPYPDDPYYHCKVILSSIILEMRRTSDQFYTAINGYLKSL